MSRSLQLRALLSLLPLVAFGNLAKVATASARSGNTLICHHAGPRRLMEMWVDDNALMWHIEAHGDNPGACPTDGGGGTPT